MKLAALRVPIEQHVLPGDQHVVEDDKRIDLVEAVGERIVLGRGAAGEAGAADVLQPGAPMSQMKPTA